MFISIAIPFMGWIDNIDLQGFSQILNTIWLKSIYFLPSADPINGTAIDTKNTTLYCSYYFYNEIKRLKWRRLKFNKRFGKPSST
jgi:hypothetical protein